MFKPPTALLFLFLIFPSLGNALKLISIADGGTITVLDSSNQQHKIQAYARKLVNRDDLIEFGEIVAAGVKARTNGQQITLADLTGVAVQGIKIALSVYESYTKSSK